MPAPLDPVRLDAWRAFLTAHRRLVDRLAEEFGAAQDLPLTWYDVLVRLDESPEDRARMSDLADRVLLSPSGLTRMAGAGLVERRRCPTDRRSTFVFGARLDDDEARTLRAALERVTRALDETARA